MQQRVVVAFLLTVASSLALSLGLPDAQPAVVAGGDTVNPIPVRAYSIYSQQPSRLSFLADDGNVGEAAYLKAKRNYDFVRFGRSAPTKKASYDYIRFGKRSSNPFAAFRSVRMQNQ